MDKKACCSGAPTAHSKGDHHHSHHHGGAHDTHNHDDSKSAITCCSSHKSSLAPAAITSHRSHEDTHVHNSSSICLAVVREDGADVVIFDASGAPRTFKHKGDIRNLCFKTHGFGMADDLLTPCFDEDGNHGSPEEDCFCGIDTPHLHAHLYDPTVCQEHNVGDNSIHFLASQTLHPIQDTVDGDFSIGVSEYMPKECNSDQVSGHVKPSHKHHWRRMHKVKHDDHVDYLVHNTETGDLHLEHPCGDCGKDDVHGSFRSVGQRRLKRSHGGDIKLLFFEVAQSPFSLLEYFHSAFELRSDRVAAVTPLRTSPRSSSQKSLPKATSKKTTVSSTLFCSRICCASECPAINKILTPLPGVDKILINVTMKQVIVKHDPLIVSAADLEKALNKENMGASVKRDGAIAAGISTSSTSERMGRSQFYVANICCASEIPAINAIVDTIQGVKSVSVNTTTKTVYVDHDCSAVSARTICDALNDQSFGAEVRFDAATSATSARSTFVESKLTLQLDADPDTEILTAFLSGFDSSQMESFYVDVPSKNITVSHNPFSLTAQAVAQALQSETGLLVSVCIDGADPERWKLPKLVDQPDDLEKDELLTFPKPFVLLSGALWIVSMMHYQGGKWYV
jgi:copper chaperone CopZ